MTLASSPAALDAPNLAPAKPKIDSLTSLRFFAAAMIVVYHSQTLLGLDKKMDAWGMDQGVSFFFVLSGFVLTYVYPSMKSAGGAGRFLSRFARIWPAHITALLITLYVTGYFSRGGWLLLPKLESLASITMVQAWIPLQHFINFANGPSWSISTEFFLYLCFPLLIINWEKSWPWKLLLGAAVSAGVLTFCKLAKVPIIALNPTGVTVEALTYNNPLGRIFEFIVGMCAAQAWRIFSPRFAPSKLIATSIEILALAFAIASGYYSVHLPPVFFDYLGVPELEWIYKGGLSCFAFAVLIVVMAFQKGWLSQALSTRPLVLLGELSFSVYLLQLCILDYYYLNINVLRKYPHWLSYTIFWLLLLAMSYVVWTLIERPCRTMLVSLWPSHQPARPRRDAGSKRSFYNPNWMWGIAGAIFMSVLIGLVSDAAHLPMYNVKEIEKLQANDILKAGQKNLQGAIFGEKFTLAGARATRDSEGVKVEMVWKSNVSQELIYNVAIQVLDANGNAIAVVDVPQDAHRSKADAESLWRTEILVPNAKLANGKSLGLVLHMRADMLNIDRGPRYNNNYGLLIRLPQITP